MSRARKGLYLVILLFCPLLFAMNEIYQFESKTQEQQFYDLIKAFRCVTCPNQNIADSQASVAKAMTDEIYQRLKKGESPQAIQNFLLERYGEYVLYRPPLNKHTWVLWLGPFIIVLVSVLIWGCFFYRVKREAT